MRQKILEDTGLNITARGSPPSHTYLISLDTCHLRRHSNRKRHSYGHGEVLRFSTAETVRTAVCLKFVRRKRPVQCVWRAGLCLYPSKIAASSRLGLHSLRGNRLGDLLVPVSRGLTRVEDRDVPVELYRAMILEKVSQFKTAIAYDYSESQATSG